MGPERIFSARHASRASMRKVRGSGWHRKGYRDLGCMWINVNEGHYTRGRDVGESDSLADFAHDLDEPGRDGFWCDVFFRKKSIFDLVEENPGDVVEDWFDGGETVYRKWYDPNGWEHKDTGFRYVPTGKRAHRCCFGSPERDQYGQIVGPEEPEPPIASMPQPRNRLALELARSFAMVEQEVERYALATPAQRRRIDDEQDIYQRAYTDWDNYPPDGPVRFEPPVCQQPRVLQEYRPPPPLTLAQRQTERAIGRTPEEIIALERALAARRARRAPRQA
ncbi:hypothetical protein KJ359_004351 [Pestalotiopsis sp. 9143b]|nr:hypothetical protein KJ359_004351 [Pestalotiopsis sp. 9143b]